MTFAKVSEDELVSELADTGNRYLIGLEGAAAECFSERRVAQLARLMLDQFSTEEREHCMKCPECARTYSWLRRTHVLNALPERVHVPLACPKDAQRIDDQRIQIAGRISLERLDFQSSVDDSDWIQHALYVRLNIVVDFELNVFSVSLLDVPTQLQAVSIQGPSGWTRMELDEEARLFQLDQFFEPSDVVNRSFAQADLFTKYAQAGRLRVRFEFRHGAEASEWCGAETEELLFCVGAIEHDSYRLPNGLRTDTHVNLGNLCRYEYAIDRLANAFDDLFRRVKFDCILAHGWAMSTIGRRLANLRGRFAARPEEAVSMGYGPPILMSDISPGSRVLVLGDVAITSALVNDLGRLVSKAGATVAGFGVVATASTEGISAPPEVRSLCQVEMSLEPIDPDKPVGPNEWVFNPCSCMMTKRLREARSPSEFLHQDPEAAEFWRIVDRGDAYQLHAQEGDAHYIAFIDTLKLMTHQDIGEELLDRFSDRLRESFAIPDIIFVPKRRKQRSEYLGKAAAERLRQRGKKNATVVVASRGEGGWRVRDEDLVKFTGAKVLVVDTAVGHGRTIDQLCAIAQSLQPAGVAAGALISRLPEAGETALNWRLSDGFVSLFHLPIQPFVIRGSKKDVCPICSERAAVKAATEWDEDLFAQLDKWMSRVPIARTDANASPNPRKPKSEQLRLFPSDTDSFLFQCRPSVAGAVTLHSLNAAKMNGMASLALPELLDPELKSTTRAAMVEHLPPRVLEWSGEGLERELEQVLATSDKTSLWWAAAKVMSRENYGQWYEYLTDALQRCKQLQKEPSPVFWGNMIWNAYMTGQGDAATANELRSTVAKLLDDHCDSAARPGLERMLKAIAANAQ